jgi:hypothetical protein
MLSKLCVSFGPGSVFSPVLLEVVLAVHVAGCWSLQHHALCLLGAVLHMARLDN